MNGSLDYFSSRVSDWRKILATLPADARAAAFVNAADDIAGLVANNGVEKPAAVDVLFEIAHAHGDLFKGDDEIHAIVADALARAEENAERVPDLESPPQPRRKSKGNGHTALPLILSKAEFIKGFVPPDYLIDGIFQRRFVYSLTGVTGHAKSAIALLISELVSSPDKNAMFGIHRVQKGQVAYFVGENPDDIRMRVIGADSKRNSGDNPLLDRIVFIPGQFNIGEMFTTLHTELGKRGGFDLIVVDTSAAYFLGNEELSNTQMGAHARMLRSLTLLPGGPCVLVLCHPIKHAVEAHQLVPRGGGAFLAEVDGNLTSWKSGETIELGYNKMRGPGFEPMSFKLESFTTPRLADAKGREIPTVRAVVISQEEQDRLSKKLREEQELLLAKLLERPEASIAELAESCGWTYHGEPAKSKVHRMFNEMLNEKPAYIRKEHKRCLLTEEGKKIARDAALRLERAAVARAQQQQLEFTT